jgi:hypothetical protein
MAEGDSTYQITGGFSGIDEIVAGYQRIDASVKQVAGSIKTLADFTTRNDDKGRQVYRQASVDSSQRIQDLRIQTALLGDIAGGLDKVRAGAQKIRLESAGQLRGPLFQGDSVEPGDIPPYMPGSGLLGPSREVVLAAYAGQSQEGAEGKGIEGTDVANRETGGRPHRGSSGKGSPNVLMAARSVSIIAESVELGEVQSFGEGGPESKSDEPGSKVEKLKDWKEEIELLNLLGAEKLSGAAARSLLGLGGEIEGATAGAAGTAEAGGAALGEAVGAGLLASLGAALAVGAIGLVVDKMAKDATTEEKARFGRVEDEEYATIALAGKPSQARIEAVDKEMARRGVKHVLRLGETSQSGGTDSEAVRALRDYYEAAYADRNGANSRERSEMSQQQQADVEKRFAGMIRHRGAWSVGSYEAVKQESEHELKEGHAEHLIPGFEALLKKTVSATDPNVVEQAEKEEQAHLADLESRGAPSYLIDKSDFFEQPAPAAPSGGTGVIGPTGGIYWPPEMSGGAGGTGATGPTGAIGPNAPSNVTGSVGFMGATGPTGATGSTYVPGVPGPTGATGTTTVLEDTGHLQAFLDLQHGLGKAYEDQTKITTQLADTTYPDFEAKLKSTGENAKDAGDSLSGLNDGLLKLANTKPPSWWRSGGSGGTGGGEGTGGGGRRKKGLFDPPSFLTPPVLPMPGQPVIPPGGPNFPIQKHEWGAPNVVPQSYAGGNTFHMPITVNAPGASKDDAGAIAEKVAERVERELPRMLNNALKDRILMA